MIDPAQLLGNAVARSTQTLGHSFNKRMRPLAIIIFLLAAPFVFLAQSSGRGKLYGVVTDAADATIPKVQIVFESHQLRQEVVSDESGNYEVQLPSGTYTVSAKKQGYRPPKPQTVSVKSNAVTRWDIQFPPIGDTIEDPRPDPTPIRKPVFSGAWSNKSLDRSHGQRVSHHHWSGVAAR